MTANTENAQPDTVLTPTLEAEYQIKAQRLINTYQKELKSFHFDHKVEDYITGQLILKEEPQLQVYVLLEIVKRGGYEWTLSSLQNTLFARSLAFNAHTLELLLSYPTQREGYHNYSLSLLRPVERFIAQGNNLSPMMVSCLRIIQKETVRARDANSRKIALRVSAMLDETSEAKPDPGETWADKALADLALMTSEQQKAWSALFAHALQSDKAKPSAQWRSDGKALVEAVGVDSFDSHVSRWFSAVTSPSLIVTIHPQTGVAYESSRYRQSDANVSLLKGLAWLCADRAGSAQEKDLVRALAKLVMGCIKKIPGVGPWAARAASAGVWALVEIGTSDAVAQLGILKTNVSFRTVLNAIESGLETAAQKAGMTKADLEDIAVPTYGFDSSGVRQEKFGDCAVIAILLPTSEISIRWYSNGKPLKAPSADAKKNFAAELKEFKADMDAAAKTLTAQKARFDSFYLPERIWKLNEWQERFGTHPLLSDIAFRLIWHFSDGAKKAQGLFDPEKNTFEDFKGTSIDWLSDETEVRLWHPIGFSIEEIIAWRNRLQELQITQPFKQAYREVYILTEAELRTNTYSNRFAGHLLKQHQMNALAALRGWRNALRLMVDDVYPPASKTYPDAGIRVEFWIEGAGDDYGTHTTDTGTYLYLSTDQVRFYAIDAPENYAHAGGGRYEQGTWRNRGAQRDPLPLTEVPAIVFSEAMRDVDMFVGVCSVGNDPAWRDGGTVGAFAEYWSDYSFGDLSATAQTRRVVLEKLLPRLKIAAQCELTDKFLVVQGSIRTYKIHLGSGNILMEPNDQYLCIVESRKPLSSDSGTSFLPYEGDQRLALILSKAFLLAEDTKITDETITRQLKRG